MLPSTIIEPRFLGPPAHTPVATPTELSHPSFLLLIQKMSIIQGSIGKYSPEQNRFFFLLLIGAAIRCVEVSGRRRCKNNFTSITEMQAGSRSYREMREIVSSAASRSLYTHIYVTSLSGASQPAAAAAAVGFVILPDPVWPQRE